ncbi:MAG: O-antigen polysaccharide polymerase Wzy family protein [Bacillota bacterium]|nr:O-antigen polysaccharide polymerase Wzy family protein [Bacillota bacterium]
MEKLKEHNLRLIISVYILQFIFLLIASFYGSKNGMVFINMITYLFTLLVLFFQKNKGYQFIILFYLSLYVFILSRPSIVMIKGMRWPYFSTHTICVSQSIIFFTIVFLYFGFYFGTKKMDNSFFKMKKDNFYDLKFIKIIRYCLIVTMCCNFINELSILLSNFGHYTNIYIGMNDGIPVIKNIAEFNIYVFVLYLATKPSKKNVTIFLMFYLLCGLPGFILGARSAIIVKIIFCFSYLLLRQCAYGEIWFNKKIKIICFMLLPVLICLMSVVNYTREGESVLSFSPIDLTVDFLYKQGTSYDTLCETIEYRNKLRDDYYINYTFGQGIDFFLRNKISCKLTGLDPLENGNGIVNATQSNNLAHRISYISLGKAYLEGHGRGTTYMSEIYLDFGYMGLIFFNFFIGLFFSKIIEIFKKNTAIRFLCLLGMEYLFIIPRFAFFSIFSYLISYYFWLFIIIIFVCYKVLIRRKLKNG